MLVDRKNFSLHRNWLILAAVGTVGAVGWYVAASRRAGEWLGGSSLVGLTLGILAGLIIGFEFLLWPRKKFRVWRVGATQIWMRAHIWLGLLSVPLVVLHSGFALGGQLTIGLVVLFAIVIASGVYGLVLQQVLPRLMFEQTPAETIYSQIDYIAGQLCEGAEELVLAACGAEVESNLPSPLAGEGPGVRGSAAQGGQASFAPRTAQKQPVPEAGAPFVTIGALRTVGRVQGKVLQTQVPAVPLADPAPLRAAFFGQIEPFLRDGGRANSPLRRAGPAANYFQELKTHLEPAAQPVVEALEGLCDQRRQFLLQARLHAWLHGWLWVHLPLSVALVILLLVHIVVALRYW